MVKPNDKNCLTPPPQDFLEVAAARGDLDGLIDTFCSERYRASDDLGSIVGGALIFDKVAIRLERYEMIEAGVFRVFMPAHQPDWKLLLERLFGHLGVEKSDWKITTDFYESYPIFR